MVVAASMALTVQIKCAHTDTRLRRFDPIVGMRTSFISHDTRLTNVIIMATLDQSREIEFHGKRILVRSFHYSLFALSQIQ